MINTINKVKLPNGQILTQEEFEAGFYKRNPPDTLKILKDKTVGIAGAGGLGSNVAIALARSGIYNLIIADFDIVEISNLNRQQYFYSQIGLPKVHALKENLLKINPFLNIQAIHEKITPDNVETIFKNADILVEAFDKAEMKVMLTETWCKKFPEKFIVLASGLAGIGNTHALKIKQYDKIIICGDQISEANEINGLIAPRVAIAANMEANSVIELLIKGGIKTCD